MRLRTGKPLDAALEITANNVAEMIEPLADFPSGSDVVDARRMNAFLEEQVVKFPEQYYWVHRRFKHRPPGMASVY